MKNKTNYQPKTTLNDVFEALKPDEIKVIKIIGTDNMFISANDKSFLKTQKLYGKTHLIEPVIGTTPLLSKLKNNQSVVSGGKHYHFRLTELTA